MSKALQHDQTTWPFLSSFSFFSFFHYINSLVERFKKRSLKQTEKKNHGFCPPMHLPATQDNIFTSYQKLSSFLTLSLLPPFPHPPLISSLPVLTQSSITATDIPAFQHDFIYAAVFRYHLIVSRLLPSFLSSIRFS